MKAKIQPHHTEKTAYIYLRQSTMGQVAHHKESTERQYALTKRARDLGWSDEHIHVLDRDLGFSGTDMQQREDFKILVADVSMNKVGALFALEVSRLSRSNTDWHRLLELCALTNTLIIDEDGCYDPKEFNDQLLLGLKGTMSQAEIHFLRSRLQGGKLNKAKKGELKIPLPVGFCYDRKSNIILDKNQEVQKAVRSVFTRFRQTGSAYGVVRWFRKNKMKFPKRIYGGKSAGKLVWNHLYYGRVLGILRNPAYTGLYVYGRHNYTKALSADGYIKPKKITLPITQWKVNIEGHHPGYITWKEFLENRETLSKNRTNEEGMMMNGPAREGLALLQGMLLCKGCGRKLTVRYKGNGGVYPSYECLWRKKDGLSDEVLLLRAPLIDKVIEKRVLSVINSFHIKIALRALEDLEKRNHMVERQWHRKIEQAEEETHLSQKRYEETDPSNRLVISTLESRWNDAMSRLEQIRADYTKYQQRKIARITPQQKKKIIALAEDLPKFWSSPKTEPRDRKRIVRLLIKDITVEKNMDEKKIYIFIRWQGGASEKISIDIPDKIYDRIRYAKPVVEQITQLARILSDKQIARHLNQSGEKSAKGKKFTSSIIRWIRRKHNIAAPKRLTNEYTVSEVSQKFNINTSVVYYWIRCGYVETRRLNKQSPHWIKLDEKKEEELRGRIKT